jgi:Putative glutamine amidotransferase
MSGHLIFDPLLSPLLIGLLGAGGLLLCVLAFGLKLKGSLIRALMVFALSGVLANPVWVEQQTEPLRDVAVLVTDASESMTLDGRSVLMQTIAQTIREKIAADPELELVETQVLPSPEGTALFSAIKNGTAKAPPGRLAGVMVLSDGLAHDLPPTDMPDAPVHTLRIGDPEHGDRSLRIINAPRYGLVGEMAQFILHIADTGQPKAKGAVVSLRVDGGEALRVRVAVGKDVSVNLPIEKRGDNVVQIEVEPAAEELTLINNRTAVKVNGIRDRLRVLLVTGEPYAGVRAWRNLLKSDPAVDLVHFTILRPPLKIDPTPVNEMALIAFPTRELFVEKLNSFDLIIFDRYTRRGVLPMLYLDHVARYVESGGALLVVAGPEFAGPFSLARTPLSSILPARSLGKIKARAFRPTLTPKGARHPVTAPLASMAKTWGRWGRLIDVSSFSGTAVLADEQNAPLMLLDRVGKGRVAMFMSDHAWLWSRGFDGGGPHAELYRRLAHWLMKEPELEEEALRATVKNGQLDIRQQTLADTAKPVEVTGPDGSSLFVALKKDGPGTFSAVMPASASGLYSIRSGKLLAVASGGALNPKEYAKLIPSAKALRPLSERTRGGVYNIRTAADLPALRRTSVRDRQAGRTWLGLQRNGAYVVTGEQRRPLLPAILIVLLLLGLAAGAWWREGHR